VGVLTEMGLSKLYIRGVSAALFAAIIGIIVQQRANTRLRRENAELQQRLAELEERSPTVSALPPNADGENFEKERIELARLRCEVGALRASTQELAHARFEVNQLQAQLRSASMAAAPATKILLAEGLVPALSWSNAWMSTPAAAYETLLWARNYGQHQILKDAFVLDEGARAKAATLFANLPEALQQKFPSPEDMIAGLLRNTTAVAGMKIIEQIEQGADAAKLRVNYQYADGRVRDDTIEFQRSGDGWRQVISEALLDKLGQNLVGIIRAPVGTPP